jgi:hypothetical protein
MRGYPAVQVVVQAPPLGPVPWKPNSVDWPAPTRPLYETLVNDTAPLVPELLAFHTLVTAASARPASWVSGVVPAVTRTVTTNPVFHPLTAADAVQPGFGAAEEEPGAELDGGTLDGGAELGGRELGGCELGPLDDGARPLFSSSRTAV